MLVSFVLIISPKSSAIMPLTLGRALQALFLKLVSTQNSRLAEELHAPARFKPYTISPLRGQLLAENGGLLARAGQRYWLRITSIDEKLSQTILTLDRHLPDRINILKNIFDVSGTALNPVQLPWAVTTTYGSLYNQAGTAESDIDFEFSSPTTFRSGKINTPFPLPGLVFGSLIKKWNFFAPSPVSIDLISLVEEQVLLSRYELKTHMLDYNDKRQVGFEGKCKFVLPDSGDNGLSAVINLLADFAFFAGVGAKTTMGMGQARRLVQNY